MNDKIDALVKKATIRVNNPILNSDGKIVVDDWEEGVSISMLAELIIKECLTVVKSNIYGPNGKYDYSYSDEDLAADSRAETIYEQIVYHFGVKE